MITPPKPKAVMINGMVTIGGLTENEFNGMRSSSNSDLIHQGHERHKKMIARRALHLTNKVDTGLGQKLNSEMSGSSDY